MSSIPNSAIPHAKPAEPRPEKRKRLNLFKVATAPAVVALGLSVMAVSHLKKRLRRDRSEAPAPTFAPVV